MFLIRLSRILVSKGAYALIFQFSLTTIFVNVEQRNSAPLFDCVDKILTFACKGW